LPQSIRLAWQQNGNDSANFVAICHFQTRRIVPWGSGARFIFLIMKNEFGDHFARKFWEKNL